MLKLAPTAVHYLMWTIGALCALSPKLAMAVPALAPVAEQVSQQGPLLVALLGTASASAFQAGATAASAPAVQSDESAAIAAAEKALANLKAASKAAAS